MSSCLRVRATCQQGSAPLHALPGARSTGKRVAQRTAAAEAAASAGSMYGHGARPSQYERYPDHAISAQRSPWEGTPTPYAFCTIDVQRSAAAVKSSWTAPVTRATHWTRYPHLIAPIAVLFGIDRAFAAAFKAAHIAFPPALAGVMISLATLSLLEKFTPKMAARVIAFFDPAVYWVARWMPVFFVPSLIVLPLSAAMFSSAELATVGLAIALGWAVTLLAAAGTAKTLRHFLHTELTAEEEVSTMAVPVQPFKALHLIFWAGLAAVSLLGSILMPAQQPLLGVPFLLASTVAGYLIGASQPTKLKAIFHPLVICTILGTTACALWGQVTGISYPAAMKFFLQTGTGSMGAGNVLMNLLGVVVLSDSFRIHRQRSVVQRHLVETVGTCAVMATVSLFASAFIASSLGLGPDLARALLSRSVTVALALPVAGCVGASASLTTAVVCATGLLGAALGQTCLRLLGVKDEIARGVAQAASSHGLGSAAMGAREPQALPFCAVTTASMGAITNLLVCLPPVKGALLAITG